MSSLQQSFRYRPDLRIFWSNPGELRSGVLHERAAFQQLNAAIFILSIVAAAQLVIVPVFLRHLARALKAKDQEASCASLLKVNTAVILFWIAGRLLAFNGLLQDVAFLGGLVTVFSVVAAVLGVASTIWHVVILYRLRRAASGWPGAA